MSTKHTAAQRPFITRTIRWMSLPIILGWLALTIVVNIAAPQLEAVGKTHSVSLTPNDAPSLIAMKRIGKDFQQFDSDTTRGCQKIRRTSSTSRTSGATR
jgi:putative drug exporter of the RND superfamily